MPTRMDSELLPKSNLDSTKLFSRARKAILHEITLKCIPMLPRNSFRIWTTDISRIVEEFTPNISKKAILFRTPTSNHF